MKTSAVARRVWLVALVASAAVALVLAVTTESLVAGVLGGVMFTSVAAAAFAAAHLIVTKDTRLPLSADRSLFRGSAVVVLVVVLFAALARETLVTLNVYKNTMQMHDVTSSHSVNRARPMQSATLDPPTGSLHDAFFAACGCSEEESANATSAFAVRVDVPSGCWLPLVKPIATRMHAETSGGGTHFVQDVKYDGTIYGFVSTPACERMLGTALGDRFRQQVAKWRK